MAYDVNKVIEVAMGEVGYLEKKSNSQLNSKTANAGSANWTKYGAYFSTNPAAWCDMFVDWCFVQAYGRANAKALLGGKFSGYTPTSAQYYKNMGRWHTKNPQVGDQIFFKNSVRICHTGIVYKVTSTTVYTIEGNTSAGNDVVIANGGAVAKKSYALNNSRIAGYGRPNYGNTAVIRTTLEKGDTGAEVKELQQNLIKLGFSCGAAGADGDFGQGTLSAVKNFQKQYGLTVDGIVGSVTQAKIKELLNKNNSSTTQSSTTSPQGFKSLYVGTGKKGMLVTTALNYRTKPVDGIVKGTLKKGQYVFPTERTAGGAFPSYWFKVNGYWCSGKYLTGWVLDKTNNLWWYMEGDKYLKSEWKQIDGVWYYFKSDGYMASNTYVKASGKNVWYYVNADGAWVTSKDVTTKPNRVVK